MLAIAGGGDPHLLDLWNFRMTIRYKNGTTVWDQAMEAGDMSLSSIDENRLKDGNTAKRQAIKIQYSRRREEYMDSEGLKKRF